MTEIKAPFEFSRSGNPFAIALFVAGGITGTSDWQAEMAAKIGEAPLILLNPRRTEFNFDERAATQIEWEYAHLRRANAIIFWFPKESICPIALFEYGYWLGGRKPLFVGCDSEYPCRNDIEHQTRLERPDLTVVGSLDALVNQILLKYGSREQRQALGGAVVSQSTV